jgi:adenylate kinase family enzyme
MHRIVIAGCPGAGKSTAATRLAGIAGLPIIHLDRHYWLPGWQRPPADIWRAKVQELACLPQWIMDGNYAGTLDVRLARADTLIHLDFSTWVCVTRALRRTWRVLGRQRGHDLPDGCPERLDWRFLLFVLQYRRKHRARDLKCMHSFSGKVHRFATPTALEVFLAALSAGRQASAPPAD